MSSDGHARNPSRRERLYAWLNEVFATTTIEDIESREPVGDGSMPPEHLYIDEEYIDQIGLKFDGQEYRFTVENGELGLERSEND